ncbi:peptide chain release factor 3 [Vitreimonas flagellata]|uniref:peptide chain release factor 3 n=1 Tax=Vitreimonas flagellata TaxID=2560861 RepID=UPI001074C9C7|nr:peptide chain release factor 3 [Vitreimonas flagellata]
MSADPATEAARRRTFAIISHPDAGKTTLTETLLLAGGAIHLAGAVAARGQARRTKSDWMKIERERGISVSSSVMMFEHDGMVFNLLDTPGHEDFSEDTYRTLTAADSAIMVLDAAKGIEPQTLKLFEVCRLRDIPITTFINKMDREAQDPFALLDEIHSKLAMDTAPMYWPAASGQRFAGMLDLTTDEFVPFKRLEAGEQGFASQERQKRGSADFLEGVSDDVRVELAETAELARDGLPKFDLQAFREGHLTPVYFGSALRRFGVLELLAGIGAHAPAPAAQKAIAKGVDTDIEPGDDRVTGFVFKIQANMDPKHRDRVGFFRVVSGRFKRGMTLKSAIGKSLNVHNPLMFMAQEREIADEAFPGDVIGIPSHGGLRVGDSLSENGDVSFKGIPNFAPEILKRVRVRDPLKQKHLRKALESLGEEGVTQVFRPVTGGDLVVGAVGQLQFEVLDERMKAEYGLEVMFETSPYQAARWISADSRADLDAFMEKSKMQMAEDVDGSPVFLGKSDWEIGYVLDKNPNIRFATRKERT